MSHRSKIGSLFDVDTKSTAPLVNNVLQFDGTNWIPASLTAGATELNDLTDVNTGLPGTPTLADDGKMLYFDQIVDDFVTNDNVTHGTVLINAKKDSAGTITKGKPVYLVGFDNDLHTVEEANANAPGTMPVIGFAAEDLDNSNRKHVMTFGKLTGIDTSSFSIGDTLFIDTTTGSLTTTRPTGTALIQRIAKVLKSDASGGQILIFNTARTAGLPNLPQNEFWVGDSNSHATSNTATEVRTILNVEDGANVTNTTSVTASGALMDSELASIADVKALNQSLVSGAAPVLDASNFTNLPSGGITIGDAISGVTNNTVLFADGSGNLLYNSKFLFNGTSLNFTGPSIASTTCTSFGLNAGNGNGSTEVVSIGNGAGQSSSGVRKTSIGYSAGRSSTGTEGTFLGNSAGQSSGGNRNQYIGYRCGMNRSSGGSNNGMGDYSLFAGSGSQNAALGGSSQNSSVGSYNSSVGSSSLSFNSGSNNSAIGYLAGNSNTGDNVLALGDLAGWGNNQSNVTIIGQSHLPQFAGALAAAAALPAASPNGVYLYWDTLDDTIKARP